MAELAHSGVFPYFSFYVGADIMDSKSNLFQLYQGGISLGEREYYLDNDDVTTNIRNKYKEHIVKMFQLAGFDEAAAKKENGGCNGYRNPYCESFFQCGGTA